ncbi:MAG TPA: PQQ-binding-like beta-propeller repeat protein [Terriglobales bacterium]|nr:PQQ-binding-like beta-propeller repeat protein [Terriglobales bacterium]
MLRTRFACLLLLAIAAGGDLSGQKATKPIPDQWPSYMYDSDYSPLTQITPENVPRLTEAWTFHYGAGYLPAGSVELDYRFEIQPLLVNGVMYFSTPSSPRDPSVKSTITALEPETGKVLWQYQSPLNIHGRGIAYWKGNGKVGPRLFFATDKGYLMALDLQTHEPADDFGADGQVDAYVGVASEVVGESKRDTFTLPNPVTVYKNLLITGARPGEGSPPEPRGDIRAWDAVTGKLVWDFHTIPWPGEPNHDDWTGDTWKDRSGANVWSSLTADEANGLVFGATGDSNHADTAPGMNLYANTLLALDGDTGKLKWFHQLIHHEASDYDMPTPPLLIDVHQNGRVIPALFQTGKVHLAYIFNRITGEPIFGMEDRPEKGAGPGTTGWTADENHPDRPATQPIPLKPPPTGRMFLTRKDLNKMTPEIEKYCTDFWDANHIEDSSPFQQSTLEHPVVQFTIGPTGGWSPPSYNPQLGLVFVNVTNLATFGTRRFGGGRRGAAGGAGRGEGAQFGLPNTPDAGGHGVASESAQTPVPAGGVGFSYRLASGATVSCMAPPYGAMVAIDVNKGEIAWRVPLGVNESLVELGQVGLNSGLPNVGGSIATASGLVFIGAATDHRFRAYDAKTGSKLWEVEVPADAHATPITYMGKDGAQYVVIAAAGGGPLSPGLHVSDALIAYKLATR